MRLKALPLSGDLRFSEYLFTITYLVFITSGLLKSAFGWLLYLPIDITLISAVLLSSIVLYELSRKPIINVNVIFFIFLLSLFYIWYALTLTYTLAPNYGQVKVINSLLNALAIISPLIKKINHKQLFMQLFIISVITSLVNINGRINFSVREMEALSSLYLYTSLALGFCVLIFFFNKGLVSMQLSMIIVFTCLLLLLIQGARGPLLSVAILMFILLPYKFHRADLFKIASKIKAWNVIKLILSALVISIIILIFKNNIDLIQDQIDRVFRRFYQFSGFAFDTGISERLRFIDLSKEMIGKSPFIGHGVGSFTIFLDGVDDRKYPHNLVLELWSEVGIIGLILFFIPFLMIFLINISTLLKSPVFISIFIYSIFNVSKSYGFEDIRLILGMVIISYILALEEKRGKREERRGNL